MTRYVVRELEYVVAFTIFKSADETMSVVSCLNVAHYPDLCVSLCAVVCVIVGIS